MKFHECLKQRAWLHFVNIIINNYSGKADDIALTHRETIDVLLNFSRVVLANQDAPYIVLRAFYNDLKTS